MTWLRTHQSILIVVVAFVTGGLLANYFNPTIGPGPLPKQQARQTADRRDRANQTAQLDTARGHRATASARTSYAAGRRAETHAAKLHAQAHVIRRPLPPGADSSAAVADSLTRLLSAY